MVTRYAELLCYRVHILLNDIVVKLTADTKKHTHNGFSHLSPANTHMRTCGNEDTFSSTVLLSTGYNSFYL